MAGLSMGTKKTDCERPQSGGRILKSSRKLHRSLHHACGPGGHTTGHPGNGHSFDTQGGHAPIGSGQVHGTPGGPAASVGRMFRAE